MTPANEAMIVTLRPTLQATATSWPGGVVDFNFIVCDNPAMTTNCVNSDTYGESCCGLSGQWTLPDGVLSWGREYWWHIYAVDASTIGGLGASSSTRSFTVGVRQPTITSQLSARGVNGQEFHQQAGNYTNAVTDAVVATAGLPLSVVRSYNSMDTRRDGAFGAGWSTRFDMRIVPETVRGFEALLVTYPDGHTVRFADNKNGTFQPPPGMYATLATVAEGGWRLMDKSSTSYLFDAQGRVTKITDARGRSQNLEYGADGKLSKAAAPGGRALTFTWTAAHVTSVSTNPVDGAPLTWTYAYNGDVLESVCNPLQKCVTYGHNPGSLYRSTVLDSDPFGYWRLGEATGNAIDLGWGAGNATYDATAQRSKPGALAGTPDTAVELTPTTGVRLPEGIVPRLGKDATLEAWFKTSSSGTIMSISDNGANKILALQVAADGKLLGSYQQTATPITSANPVNDGAWHHVALTVADNLQTLYLDGTVVGTLTQTISGTSNRPTTTVGGLAGLVDEVAIYDRALTAAEVTRHHAAQAAAPHKLTKITLPSGRVWAENTYEPTTDRLKTHTDQHGGTWQIGVPANDRTTGKSTVIVTDPHNGTLTSVHDSWRGNRLISQTDQLAKVTTYGYDTNGFLKTIKDPNGNTSERSYDARGNILSSKQCRADGNCQTNYRSYYLNAANKFDPRNDMLLVSRDARSASATDNTYASKWEYNEFGEVLKTTTPATTDFPNGRSTLTAYTDGSEPAIGGSTTPPGLPKTRTDAKGSVWMFRYSAAGDLAEQVEPSGLVSKAEHDALGRVVARTQVSQAHPGGVKTTLAYDGAGRLVTRTEAGVKNEITNVTHTPQLTFIYDPDGNKLTEKAADLTGGDAERTTTYTYDTYGRVETITGPERAVVRQAWNHRGALTRVTDAAGAVVDYGYSTRGELTASTLKGWTGSPVNPQPATDVVLEALAYDPAGRLASRVDAMGRKTSYTYFDDNLPSQTIADDVKLNGSTTAKDVVLEANTYDAAGNRTKQVTGGGITTVDYVYDPAGRLTSQTLDPTALKRQTAFVYDAVGNVTKTTLTGAGSTRAEVKEYVYNSASQVTRETVENGTDDLVSAIGYDDRGLVTEVIDPRGKVPGANPADFTTTLRYDLADRLVETKTPQVQVDKAGTSTAARPTILYGYDNSGAQSHIIDAEGRTTASTFDKAGRLAKVTAPSYTPPGGTPLTPTASFVYNAAGQVTQATDPRGYITTSEYDMLGRMVRITSPAPQGQTPGRQVMEYDLLGEQLASIDPMGARVESTYDDLGRAITQTQIERAPSAAFTTKFEYNDAGRLLKTVLPGNKSTTYTVNAAGEVESETDPLTYKSTLAYDLAGRLTKATDPLGNATEVEYDLAGRQIAAKDLNSLGTVLRTTAVAYDAAGNPISQTSAEGHITRQTFDALNRNTSLVEPVSATESITTGFGYDASGAPTRTTDGRGNAVWTTYNSLGLVETLTEPVTDAHPNLADRTWTQLYDAAGNNTSTLQPGGVRIDREFDHLGRPTRQSGSGAQVTTPERAFGYDLAGRATNIGNLSLEYNDRGMLTKVSKAGAQQSAYSYDALGNPTQRVDATGTANFTWDNANRPATATDPITSRTLTYVFDEADRLTSLTATGQASSQTYTYDDLDRPLTHTLKNGAGTQLAKITYGWDKNDNLTSKTTAGTAGAGNNTYGYDHAGRLTSWTGPDGQSTDYGWDASGNRIKAGSKTFTYDQRNRLTSGDGTTYSYTPRGTVTSETKAGATKNLIFDAFDQLINDGDTAYGYDDLGRMTSRTKNGTQQNFIYSGLTNDLIEIRDTANNTQASYSRDLTGSLLSMKEGAGPAVAALTDLHGDVTATFNATALVDSTAYNPFGEIVAQTGTQKSIGYQGEYTDPDTGKVNMHARWYQPGTGNFVSRDTLTLNAGPSVQANRYTYANASPMTSIDPTGHWGERVGNGGSDWSSDSFGTRSGWDASQIIGYSYGDRVAETLATGYKSQSPQFSEEEAKRVGVMFNGRDAPKDFWLQRAAKQLIYMQASDDPLQSKESLENLWNSLTGKNVAAAGKLADIPSEVKGKGGAHKVWWNGIEITFPSWDAAVRYLEDMVYKGKVCIKAECMYNTATWLEDQEAILADDYCKKHRDACKGADKVRERQEFHTKAVIAAIGGHGFLTLLYNGDAGYGKPQGGRGESGVYLLVDKNGRVLKVGETKNFKTRQGDYDNPKKCPLCEGRGVKVMVLFKTTSEDMRTGLEDVIYDALVQSNAMRLKNGFNSNRLKNPKGNSYTDQVDREYRLEKRKIAFRYLLHIGVGIVPNGRGNKAIQGPVYIKIGGASVGSGLGHLRIVSRR